MSPTSLRLRLVRRFCFVFLALTALGGAAAPTRGAVEVTPLYTFRSIFPVLQVPKDIVRGNDGYLYGLAQNSDGFSDFVYRFSTAGEFTVLHTFDRSSPAGSSPSMLTWGRDGNLYGITTYGGARFYGTLYRLSPSGGVTVLYAFQENFLADRVRQLLQGSDGSIYGLLDSSATSTCPRGGIFRISQTGAFTVLYAFDVNANGYSPMALIEGQDRNLYGVNRTGGAMGGGTLFRCTPGGVLTTLYSFSFQGSDANNNPTGYYPTSLAQGGDGSLYGTTDTGGQEPYGSGTVFRFNLNGTFTRLHVFPLETHKWPDYIKAGSDGNVYGVRTNMGNAYPQVRHSTIFRVTPSGVVTDLYTHIDPASTDRSVQAVAQGADGHLYGTISTDYAWDPCTIFRLSIVSPSIASFSPASGPTGTGVTISGKGFDNVTAVRFGTASAAFTVVSDREIHAVVPTGATTARIYVETRDGTAASAASFSVLRVSSLSFSPPAVTGGEASQATLILSAAAPVGGTRVGLSSNSAAASVPATVTVPAGASAAVFTVSTSPVAAATLPRIAAACGDSTLSKTLTVSPPALSSLTVSPAVVGAGAGAAGTVTLTGAAPAGGVAVTLSSSNTAAATLPASVTIAAGASTAYFTVASKPVTLATSLTVSATCAGVTKTASLTVHPKPTLTSFTPISGPMGTLVTLTGTNLTHAMSVTFNGVAATAYGIVSDTQIKANVPAGATTGRISVTTPAGTATSATNFTVTVAQRWSAVDFSQAGNGSTWILMKGGASVRLQKWTGTMQIGTAYRPSAAWSAVAIAANATGGSYLLWKNGTTSYQLWIMGGTGTLSSALPVQSAGGWTATDVSAAGDGSARVLLASPSGQVKVVRVSGSTATAGPAYTPSAGWSAVGIAAGADNKTRLLWKNGATGYLLWTLTAACARETAHPVQSSGGFTAQDISQSGDGTSRVLLVSPSGQIRVARFSGDTATVGPLYTPAAGYTATAISADPDTSGRTRLLWQHTGGALNLWTLGPTGALQGAAALGTY